MTSLFRSEHTDRDSQGFSLDDIKWAALSGNTPAGPQVAAESTGVWSPLFTLGGDTFVGTSGDDVFEVDNVLDVVVEQPGGGRDIIHSTVDYTLSSNVEELVLLGDAALRGTGNNLGNVIRGNAANNVLDGGVGADSLYGGAGNDTYVVDNANDKTIEVAAGGTDLVQSSISFKLQAEIENLTLTGSGNVNATGNLLANSLTGNAGNNVLTGGAGVDTMTGGAGNDTYIVDGVNEKTIEAANGGTDLVQSSASFTLQADIENLTLTGTAANGTGNGLANTIVGNAANNVINGGAGVDTMTGGSGNDTFVVENSHDRILESLDGGIDTVQSSVIHTLQDNVENLKLTGTAVYGTGNSLANSLTGNDAANMLDGKEGNDKLTGGAGADIFALSSTLGSDLITDFASHVDRLSLSQAAIRVGDGDTSVEGAVLAAGPNGFNASAELVVVTHDIVGSITTASAATAIGHADSNYAAGDTRLFVVDNGDDSAVYLFKSADADSTVSAGELTLLATLDGTASTTLHDYMFGA